MVDSSLISPFANRMVRLKTCFQEAMAHSGFVVSSSNALVGIYEFHDFFPEGFTVFRLQDVISITSTDFEKFHEYMLYTERLFVAEADYPKQLKLPFESYEELIDQLFMQGRLFCVRCEDRFSPDNNELYFGKVTRINGDSFEFISFDHLGVWNNDVDIIAFHKITRIEFDTPYIKYLTPYLINVASGQMAPLRILRP